jgi:uncharacterized protein with GYD domain
MPVYGGRIAMPKYLFIASYTSEGAKGLAKEGGTARRAVAAKLAESLGGKLEAFYYGFGGDDVYAIIDSPDHATAAALSLAVNRSGMVTGRTVVLMTPEEMDAAVKKTPTYRPPGG